MDADFVTQTRSWCPYTDRELPPETTSPEHIIPLALGGSDNFCIPVDRGFNSDVGSKIDGALANDFFTLSRRREYDARGHSNKPPLPVIRAARMEGRPVQVSFRGNESPLLWDAKGRRILLDSEAAGKLFSGRIEIDVIGRYRFLAKVSLSAGYAMYGDTFREHVEHKELRRLVRLSPTSSREELRGIAVKGCVEFSPTAEDDWQSLAAERFSCELVDGSCILAMPTDDALSITVGILGKWIGSLLIPARTGHFPLEGDHDLGHAVLIQNRVVSRLSCRGFMQRALEALPKS